MAISTDVGSNWAQNRDKSRELKKKNHEILPYVYWNPVKNRSLVGHIFSQSVVKAKEGVLR